jgi:guanylate kinase
MGSIQEKKLIVVSAPSGAGKTTLVSHLLETIPDLAFSVSATTRAPRPGETNGKDYFFITETQFKAAVSTGDLLEWEEVYNGTFYGTLKSEVNRMLNSGFHVVFDVDVVGGLNIKKHFGRRALAIFISPPSVEVLEERLINRRTDQADKIKQRIEKARWELGFAPEFDLNIVNHSLEKAKAEILRNVTEFLNKS